MERVSPPQFRILKALAQPVSFERAIEFNQTYFYSLVRRGFVELDMQTEQFSRSTSGNEVVERYNSNSIDDFFVEHKTASRHDKIAIKFYGKKRLERAKKAVSARAAA